MASQHPGGRNAPDPEGLLALANAAIDLVLPRLSGAAGLEARAADTKTSPTDLVTEFDRWAETTLVDHITTARPGDGVLGEEGTVHASTTGVEWLIDPIDGTTNFVYDLPGSSVSVAARVDGRTVAGAVHDLVRDERFTASVGTGGFRNGAPIAASDEHDLATALVATGFSYDADRRRAQAETLVEVLPAVRDIRRFGGAAIDLCSLACGRVDAYYERGLSPWDSAAGALIASESGAIVDDRGGGGGALLGAAPGIATSFFALIERAGGHTA